MRGQPDATPATVAPGAPRVPGWGRVWRALAVVLALAVLGGGFWGVLSTAREEQRGWLAQTGPALFPWGGRYPWRHSRRSRR